MDNFLQSSVLPGNPIEKHEHRRMLVVLIIIIAVGVIVSLVFLWKNYNKNYSYVPVVNTEPESVIEMINRSAVTLTEQEKIDAALELSWSEERLTDEQKSEIAKKLLQTP